MRRSVVTAAVLLTASLVACSDDGEPERTIAFLRTSPVAQESQDALLAELEAAGWEVGENLTVLNADPEAGVADGEEAADAARAYVEDGADLVIALSTSAAMGALEVAADVPVIVLANDPVASGLVADARRPDGNVTGVSFRVPADRTIDIARQLVGDDGPIGLLWPTDDPGADPIVASVRDTADALDIEIVDAGFAGPGEVRAAVGSLAGSGVRITILANAPATVRAFEVIERETATAGIAAVSNTNQNEFAVAVLAPRPLTAYRQLGRQAVRLLGGTPVEEVPLEDPGEFALLLRRSVADAFGLVLTDELVQQADVVEE